jgi:serine/threonine-protein kinase
MTSRDGGGARRVGGYLLHGELAAGGMGTVHLGAVAGAVPPRWVAIKHLHGHHALEPEHAAMFFDEARLAARVRHPNVVATLDVLVHEAELYLVMELVRGASLAAAASAGPVPPSVAVRIAVDLLHGLSAVHEARDERGVPLQIVHRDVTPHNVLVGVDGATRVADFGIAQAEGRLQVTAPGRTKGTLAYMAPEQIRGERATRRSDLYAAAVVLWEALAGRRLFRGEAASEIFGKVMEGVVRPPSDHAPVGASLDALVLRGLCRDPAQRFADAGEMAGALAQALPPASAPEVAAWLARAAGPVLAAQAQRIEALASTSPPPPAHRSVFAAVAGRAAVAPAPRMAAPAATPGEEPPTITVSAPGAPARPRDGGSGGPKRPARRT